jgi:hypothetical protein
MPYDADSRAHLRGAHERHARAQQALEQARTVRATAHDAHLAALRAVNAARAALASADDGDRARALIDGEQLPDLPALRSALAQAEAVSADRRRDVDALDAEIERRHLAVTVAGTDIRAAVAALLPITKLRDDLQRHMNAAAAIRAALSAFPLPVPPPAAPTLDPAYAAAWRGVIAGLTADPDHHFEEPEIA